LFVNPIAAATGKVTVTAYTVPEDVKASITPSEAGGSQTVETTARGQNAEVTFSGTAGERVFMETPEVKYGSGCCNLEMKLETPEGKGLVSKYMSAGSYIDTTTLPVTGTYTLFVNPIAAATGKVTITAYEVPPDFAGSIEIGGSPVTVSTTVPGQNASVTFSAPASKGIKLTASSVTMGTSSCCSTLVSIKKPEGSNLVSPKYIGTSGGTIESATTVAGTYTIFVDPQGNATGKMTLTLVDPPLNPLMSSDQSALPFSDANVNLGGPNASAFSRPRSAHRRRSTPSTHKRTKRAAAHASVRIRHADSTRRSASRGHHRPVLSARAQTVPP
jgi:hypothetical protein